MRVGAVAWRIRKIRADIEFFEHLEEIVLNAKRAACDVIVLPELPVLEILGAYPLQEPRHAVRRLAEAAPTYETAVERLAKITGMTIVAGSHFVKGDAGILNVSLTVDPLGRRQLQPKVKLTVYEREEWGLAAGDGVYPLRRDAVGTLVCYDCEFPEAGRLLAESGVKVLCVPAFTETRHGHFRVRLSCHARAVENQVFVVHAALVGSLHREPVPSTYGSSAILAPSVPPFPADGVLAATRPGREEIAIADIDLGTLDASREAGDVRNWNDRDPSCWVLRVGGNKAP